MDTKQAIKTSLGQSDFLVDGLLADITPEEMLARPVNGCNHIAWQLGHLIQSEHYLVDKVAPGKLAPLPEGFAERHKKGTACEDSATAFLSKEQYLQVRKQVRADALRILDSFSPEDFERPVTGVPPFTKTAGEVFVFLGTHWLMHVGQWTCVRRKLGRPPLM